MPLKIEDLEANNIFISDRNLEPRDIPKHILLLRQVFLDNHGTLQNRYNLDDDDDPWTIRCQEAWSRRRTSDQDAIKDVIENAELVAKKAKKLVANGSVENLWLKFFRVTFFEPLVKRFEPLDRGPR